MKKTFENEEDYWWTISKIGDTPGAVSAYTIRQNLGKLSTKNVAHESLERKRLLVDIRTLPIKSQACCGVENAVEILRNPKEWLTMPEMVKLAFSNYTIANACKKAQSKGWEIKRMPDDETFRYILKVHYTSLPRDAQESLGHTYTPKVKAAVKAVATNKKNSLKDVVLESGVKNDLDQIFEEWNRREDLKNHLLFPTNRILLYGPPGCGKTTIASKIADSLSLPFNPYSTAGLASKLFGGTAAELTRVFKPQGGGRVIFLDEIESLGRDRKQDDGIMEQSNALSHLFTLIDTLDSDTILIGATNLIDSIDAALLRRFTAKILICNPSAIERLALYGLLAKTHKFDPFFSKEMDQKLAGKSYSLISDIINSKMKGRVMSGSKKSFKEVMRGI